MLAIPEPGTRLAGFINSCMEGGPEAVRRTLTDRLRQVQTSRPGGDFSATDPQRQRYYRSLAGVAVDHCGVPETDRRVQSTRSGAMRYTKAALLLFGLGLVGGFVVVVGEFREWEWLAGLVMVLGLVLLPLGLFADGRGFVMLRWIVRRLSRRRRGAGRGRPVRAGAQPRRTPARPASRPPRRARR
jgi:hypothetical protein